MRVCLSIQELKKQLDAGKKVVHKQAVVSPHDWTSQLSHYISS